jgi:hypothetical protein
MPDEPQTPVTKLGTLDFDARGRVRTARNFDLGGLSLRNRRTWFTDPPPPAGDPPPAPPVKPTPPPPAEDAPTLTQKQVDAIMGNTRKEASAAALSALAKELGYDSVDDMKAAAKEAKDLRDKNMSELDKATKALAKVEAEKADALALIETERAARLADRVNTRIENLARAAKASNPEDVVDFLRSKRAEDVAGLVDKDGKIDDKAAEKMVADVKKDRPSWFAVSGPGSPSNKDGRPPQPDSNKLFGDKPLARL